MRRWVSKRGVHESRARRGRLGVLAVVVVGVGAETGTRMRIGVVGTVQRGLGRALRRRRRGVVGIGSESGRCFGGRC